MTALGGARPRLRSNLEVSCAPSGDECESGSLGAMTTLELEPGPSSVPTAGSETETVCGVLDREAVDGLVGAHPPATPGMA